MEKVFQAKDDEYFIIRRIDGTCEHICGPTIYRPRNSTESVMVNFSTKNIYQEILMSPTS